MGRQPETGVDRGSILSKILPKAFSKSSRAPSEVSVEQGKRGSLTVDQHEMTRATSEVIIKIDTGDDVQDVTDAFQRTGIESSFSNNELFMSARNISKSNSLRESSLQLGEVQYSWRSPVMSMNDLDQQRSNSNSSAFNSAASSINMRDGSIRGTSAGSSSSKLSLLPGIRKSSTESSTTYLNVNIVAPKLPKRAKPVPRKGPLPKPFKKFNSCNTLFSVDSSLYRPSASVHHLDITLKVCSYAIMSLMQTTIRMLQTEHVNPPRASSSFFRSKNGLNERSKPLLKTSEILSHRHYPVWGRQVITAEALENPANIPLPPFDEVYGLFRHIFLSMELPAEVAVIALIYVERMLESTQIMLHPINCFRVILGGIALASKVWDDQAVWNEDFCTLLPHMKVQDVKHLEQWWLSKIKWNVNVKRHLFTRYWFEMRDVAERVYQTRVGDIELQNVLKSSGQLSTFKLAHETNALRSRDFSRSSSAQSAESDNLENMLKEPDAYIVERRRKSAPLTVAKKPLNEMHMSALAISTSYSQCQLRQSISMSLALNSKRDGSSNINISQPEHKILANNKESGHYCYNSNTAKLNWDVVDVGWGGSNLRRAQSDFIYQPIIPAASVL